MDKLGEMDLSTIPLAINPNGQPPNFVNPPTLAGVTYAVCTTMIVVSALFVALRVFTNIKMYRKLPLDDYFCLLGWALTTTHGTVVMIKVETTRHAWDTPISSINGDWLKALAVLCMIYGPAMWCAKTTIFTMYLRLFGTIPWMRWACWTGIVFFGLLYWSNVPVYAVYSFPYGTEQWDFQLALKSRRGTPLMNIITAAFNVVSDLYVLALPIPIITSLTLSRRKKVGLCALFLVGLIGLGCSIIGLVYRIFLREKRYSDSTWYGGVTYLTVLVELYATIICGCAPACVAAWRHIFRDSRLFQSLRSLLYNSRASTKLERPSFVRTPVSEEPLEVKDLGNIKVEGYELKTLKAVFNRPDDSVV